MKILRLIIGLVLLVAIAAGAWIVFFHSNWIKPAREEESAEPETDVAIHAVKITRATLHRYTECFGTVGPEQRRNGTGDPSASASANARMASPVAGVVSEVFCAAGQQVEKGAALLQLDDRLARAEEGKAEGALLSAQASLAKLKASIRPEQIAVAEIALSKARQAVEYAQQGDLRQKALAKDQLSSEKQIQESALQLAGAREDETTAEKQLMLLKNSPPPEELAEASAKVAEAERALSAVHLARSLLTINAPISATVVKVNVNPGEPVDAATVIIELVDLNRLEVSAAVPATEMKLLKPGQAAEIRCAAPNTKGAPESSSPPGAEIYADALFKGTLTGIGFQVDPKTDTVMVRAALPRDSGVKPGQSARLKIMVEEHPNCLVVPEECVFRDKVGINVIAVVENNKSGLQNVTTGLRENGLIEIEGKEIKEGDIVVSAGAYGLPEETKVHILDNDAPSAGKK